MKVAKKKVGQAQKNLNDNTPKIDKYFKVAAKQLNVVVEEKNVTDESALKTIFINALEEKLRVLDGETENFGGAEIVERQGEAASAAEDDFDCASGLDCVGPLPAASQNQSEQAACVGCKQWETQFNDLRKLCIRLTIRNANIDLKYEDLLNTKTSTVSPDPDAEPTEDIFTTRELKFLDCMSLDKKADSTFVHHCLQYAYKNDLSTLSGKTLKDTAEVTRFTDAGDVERVIPGKDPLTPPKVDRIRTLFIKRISKCQLGAIDYSERIKDTYLNRLIASSIVNIVKKG